MRLVRDGRYVPGSDVDLFVVLSRADTLVRDRIPRLVPDTFPVGVDVFPFTRAEIAGLAGSPLLAAVRSSRWRYSRGTHSDGLCP